MRRVHSAKQTNGHQWKQSEEKNYTAHLVDGGIEFIPNIASWRIAYFIPMHMFSKIEFYI